jgi:hypothetical protein
LAGTSLLIQDYEEISDVREFVRGIIGRDGKPVKRASDCGR